MAQIMEKIRELARLNIERDSLEVFPEKRRVSEAMTSDLEEFSVMEDALRLLTMSSEKYHRAYEAPHNGLCPYCHIDVSRLARRNLHIHHCRRDKVARELGVLFSTLTFCYFCNEFYTPTEWEQDCRRHLSAPVVHCGSLTYRHTLVRPAFCLLCTQSNDLAAAERLQFWERDVKALDHIDRSHGWHWTCLHCNFVSDSKESGRNHLHDAHGYQFRRPKAGLTVPRAIGHKISMDELSTDMNCDQGAESLEMLAGRGDSSPDHAPEEKAEMAELTLHDGFLETNFDVRTSDPYTPPLEWSETSDDVVERLMDECLLLPPTPPSELTGSEQSYPEDYLMINPVDYKAPYYLLSTQLDTNDTKSKGIDHPLETAEMEWEHHSEANCTQLEEQPLYPPEPPKRQQLIIELRSVSTREDYESFENLSSTNDKEQILPQAGKKRFRQKLNSFFSSPGSRPKKVRSRKPGLSHQVNKTRRVRIRFTPDEDRLLLKLKADPTLTWKKIHELFSIEFPSRRSLGALQVHYTTKLQ